MALLPLSLPPGVYRNGTDLQTAGRWREASRVRWTDGTMQPIGGWLSRVDLGSDPARGAIAWRDLSGDRWFAVGDHSALYAVSALGTVTDISPSDLASGNEGATVNTGYGGAFYGTGAYGIERPDTGSYSEATTWSLDTWGENLVACSSTDGRLLEWDLNTSNDAAAISGAPTGCDGLFVTPERFLVALGPSGNYRRVQWSDKEDNTTWAASATSEAGDIELQTAGQIMLGIRGRGQSLILTSQDAHSMTYIGPQLVYGFERVGTACGAISRNCAASVDSGIYWMGARGFFVYAGGSVEPLQCDVLDYVYGDLNAVQRSKVAAVVNSKFSEIWWFYPAEGEVECSHYVSYNYKEGHWATGELARSSGVDGGVFNTPVWFGTNGVAYNHEIGSLVDDAFAESGPFQIGNGDAVVMATAFLPDESTQGQATVSFDTKFHPNGFERSYGPYTMGEPTDVRFTSRQVAMRVDGDGESDWRWGAPRLDVTPRGRR